MDTKLITIGNSHGIRLPKAVIEQAGLAGPLSLEVKDGAVIIRRKRAVREGWAEAAQACHAAGEDDLGEWDVTVQDGLDEPA